MRVLGKIVEDVMSGGKPLYEELRYAVVAYQALCTFDTSALMKLAEAEREKKLPFLTRSAVFQFEEHFNRMKCALAKSPKEWVGWNNDPDNPEVQRRRRVAFAVYEKATQISGATITPEKPTP